MSRILRWAGALTGAALVVVLTPLSYYAGAPLREPSSPRKSDAIVLFSSGQIDDRWVTSDAAQRTLGALLLYRDGYAPLIVSSGSQHTQGLHQAETQAEWLKRAGVPANSIIVENRSTRTYESVLALRQMMLDRGWKSAVIVTSELDVPRIRLCCRRAGLSGISFLATPERRPPRKGSLLYVSSGWPVLHHALYEYAGLALYKLRGWI